MGRSEAGAQAAVERFLQFALLGLVATGFLALAGSGRLDAPTVVLMSAGFLVRGLAVCGAIRIGVPPRALAIATASYAAFFVVDILWLSRDPIAAAAHLVFFLALIRILTARARRDSLQLAGIAGLELLAAALVSIDFNFFLSLGLFVVFAIGALAAAEIQRSMHRVVTTPRMGLRRFHPRLALLACSVALGILALTGGLFFILPRSADAALSRLARPAILPGFSDEVTLGQIGEIKRSSQVAMHVRIFSSDPLPALKWRGAALSDFDGRRWSEPAAGTTRIALADGHAELADNPHGEGRHLSYQVEYDSLQSGALFFAGVPEKLDLDASYISRTGSGAYSLGGGPRRRVQYEAYSRLEEPPESSPPRRTAPILNLRERDRDLQLPAPLDPRVPALAIAMAGADVTDLARARAVEGRLRRDYRYALVRTSRESSDPLAYFLFSSRQGHCEYFASAMAVLLRTLGIPSRVVTGFLGGEYNPITELWTVRASDAHSWVEAWIPEYGWTTFDPTPPDPNAGRSSALTKLEQYLDAGRMFWRFWVVDYDSGRQGTLAGRFEKTAQGLGIGWFEAVSAANTARKYAATAANSRLAIPAGIAILLGVSAGFWGPRLVRALRVRRRVERVRRGQAEGDDATLLYRRMLSCLKRRGYQKPAWFTPVEFARALPTGTLGATVDEFTSAYNALRFGGRAEVAARLSALLDELEHGRIRR